VGLFKDALEVEAYLARLMQELLLNGTVLYLSEPVPEKGVQNKSKLHSQNTTFNNLSHFLRYWVEFSKNQ
jgi:hypothetical protein